MRSPPPPPGDPAKVATPTASPAAGAVVSGTAITLSTSTSGAVIRYTINGTNPTSTTGAVYSASSKPAITADTTIKAIAYKDGMTDSDVLTASYTITTSGASGGGDPAVDCATDEVWVNNSNNESSVVFRSGDFYFVDKDSGVWSVSMYGYTYANGAISGMVLPLSYSVSGGALTIKMSGTTMGTYTKQSGQTVDLNLDHGWEN